MTREGRERERSPAVLITGRSGAGKSTLLAELARRGWHATDADDESWCVWDDGDDPGWIWREDRIQALGIASPSFSRASRLARATTTRSPRPSATSSSDTAIAADVESRALDTHPR